MNVFPTWFNASGSRGKKQPGVSYFFLPILREISSTILGRKSASTLSTMLAISSGS
jgi:hypothetical protein